MVMTQRWAIWLLPPVLLPHNLEEAILNLPLSVLVLRRAVDERWLAPAAIG